MESKKYKLLGIVLIALFMTGCTLPRVFITLPPKDASYEKRLKAYKTYHPTKYKLSVYYGNDGRTTEHHRLHLKNGQIIWHRDDLKRALPKKSLTVQSVLAANNASRISYILYISAGLGAAITGIALSRAEAEVAGNPGTSFTDSNIFWASMGIGLSSSVLALVGYLYGMKASKHTRRAFYTYHADLIKRLNLKIDSKRRVVEDPSAGGSSPDKLIRMLEKENQPARKQPEPSKESQEFQDLNKKKQK